MKIFSKILLATVLSSLVFSGCEEKIKPSVTSTKLIGNPPSQESWNSRITFTQSGKLVAIVTAGHLTVYDDRKQTHLDEKIKVDFFSEEGKQTTVLTAESGIVNDLTRDLEAIGNVVVVSDEGTTLRTDQLSWTNSTQKIHTDAYVEIDSPKEKIRGHGLESDQHLKNYKILKVTGQSAKIE